MNPKLAKQLTERDFSQVDTTPEWDDKAADRAAHFMAADALANLLEQLVPKDAEEVELFIINANAWLTQGGSDLQITEATFEKFYKLVFNKIHRTGLQLAAEGSE